MRTLSRSPLSPCLVPALVLALVATACGGSGPGGAPDGETLDEWRAQVEAFRSEREERLARPDGWLTLVGLEWLRPGAQTLGAGSDADVQLPLDGGPAIAGTLVLDPPTVRLEPAPGAGLLADGEPARPGELRVDSEGDPTVLELDRLRLYVIEREGRFGVRIKDPRSPTRIQFPGLSWYPIDPDWRVTGRLEPYERPRRIELAAAAGPAQEAFVPGLVRFRVDGEEHALAPVVSDPDEEGSSLFFVFSDRTSGSETYGAGRFLSAEPPSSSGEVVLDFNKAYSPPCAFTPYATCPLPPSENRLGIAVEAGEKDPGLH